MRADRLLLWTLTLLLAGSAALAQAQTVVRFQTTFGDVDVLLYDATTPVTVGNFLDYVVDRDYRRSFVHRSVSSPNIIQGGGFVFENGFFFVPTDLPIPLELGHSNLRGTIAMARTSEPVSATSQWFFNVSDNVALDTTGGGYTVFGEVIGGMDVVDTIRALPVYNASSIYPAFSTIPLHDFVSNPLIPDDHLVFVYRVLRVADDQCGDLNDDLIVDDLDPDLLSQHLADPAGFPLTAAGLDKCDAIGVAGACDVQDLAVLRRALAGYTPEIAPVCFATL